MIGSTSPRQRIRSFFMHNAMLKIISLIIAFLLWGFLILEKRSDIAFNIPIRVENSPEHLVMVEPPPSEIRVVARGTRTQLGAIGDRSMFYRVDLTNANAGVNVFDVVWERIQLPRGVQIVHVSPSQFSITLDPVEEKTLPVQVQFEGELPPERELTGYRIEPPEVTIEAAAGDLAELAFVETEPINLASLRENTLLNVNLALDRYHMVDASAQAVQVYVEIENLQVTRRFDGIPVPLPEGYQAVGPDTIAFTVSGPVHIVNGLTAANFTVAVDKPRSVRRTLRTAVRIEPPPHVMVESIEPYELEVRPQ